MSERKYVLYTITNLVNNKIYIGISVHYRLRMNTHFGYLKRNEHKNRYLQAEFNKYGECNFVSDIVCEYSNKYEASITEKYYTDCIFKLDKSVCYNMISGGLDVSTGAMMAWVDKLKNDPIAMEELKIRSSKINKGRKWSQEYKDNMSIATRGKVLSESTRKKIGDAQRGANGNNAKKVIDTSSGKIYGCLKEAAPYFGIKYNTLQKMLAGINKNKTTLKWL